MGKEQELFGCMNCNALVEKVDTRYTRVQDPDDLNADPDREQDPVNLSELWYCYSCGGYFKAYYKFDRVEMLKTVL